MSPRLVLASSSPRRRDLFDVLGLMYEIDPPHIDESPLPGEDPRAYVERVAREKAAAVHAPSTVVVAADTTVAVDGAVLVKPIDEADAVRMLRSIRGRTHIVYTGVALATDTGVLASVTRTEVTISEITDAMIDWYVTTGEPMDKAGAYAMQGLGGVFIDRIVGDPFNVIGLPLAPTRALFERAGLDLRSFRSP